MTNTFRPVKVSATVTYSEALEQLRIAADALDQARAMLKDIGLQHIGSGSGPYRLTVNQLADRALGAFTSLQNEECEECGTPVAQSEACLEGRCHVHAEPVQREEVMEVFTDILKAFGGTR